MGVFDFLRRNADQKVRRGKQLSKRKYAAADQSRLFADFRISETSADDELKNALAILRSRSRDLARNNEYAKRYLNLIKTNVVGENGFSLQVRARNADRSLDAAGNKIIENAFASWGRVGNPEISGRMSWLDMQRFAAETLVRDGEVFIRVLKGSTLRDGISFQFIESDLIDEKKNSTEKNGNKVRMGVELDEYHRPVAYHVFQKHPNDTYSSYYSNNTQRHERVPADEMLHIFMPSRTHQNRGEPFMAPAMSAIKMLHGYREAELTAARAAASKFAVLTTQSGDDFVGDDMMDETPIIDMEPASVYELPANMDLKLIDPTHPTSAFSDFEKAVLRGIASGLNVSYTSLSNDLSGVSYSSIRQGTIEERDHYRMLQKFLIQHFCEKIYRLWLRSALDFGTLPITENKFDKFADNSNWRGRGFAWVDPQREIQAAVVGISNGLMSMNDVAANYGRDVEELFAQIQSDKEMAERYGLKMAFEPFGTKAPAQPDVEGGDDGDV
jgi:lambda family phage portal protein